MNDITTYSASQLPDTLEDLTQFVLVGKARLQAYMLNLKNVNKLSTAQGIRDQVLEEAQEINEAVKAAEIRIGEILLAIPKATTNHKNPHLEIRDASKFKTKSETAAEMGYTKDDVSYYQQMAKNPEVVKAVLEEARIRGEIATKADIKAAIKEAKDEQAEVIKDLQEERDYLQFQVQELEKAEPKTIIPDDYETAKIQARSAEKARKEALEKLRAAETRIKDLEERKDISEIQKKLEEEAGYFTIRTYDYIQKNGGFVWITERFEQLPDKQRKEFISTVYAIDAFAKQMVQNIGGYGIE